MKQYLNIIIHILAYSILISGLFCLMVSSNGCRNGTGINRTEDSDQITYYGIAGRIRGFDPVKAGDVATAMAISKVYG